MRRSPRFLAALILGGCATILSLASVAQTISPDLLRALQQRESGETPDTNDTPTKPSVQIFQPVPLDRKLAPASRLEQLFSLRAGQNLSQFGYDVLGVPSSVSITQTGAVQDGYILGQGDEVVLVLRGQENATYRVRVDRNGRIVVPKLNPISAAGRSLGDFRRDVQSQVASSYVSTSVFVSLGELHQVSVLVAGEVRAPGTRIVSGLASALDVILMSGGIKKSGSLRNIRVVRDGVSHSIDLYAVIANGAMARLGTLRDGDRVYVPPLGSTVAVAGGVTRPGIYELPPGSSAISALALLRLAGGTEIAGSYRFSKTALARDGTRRLVPISNNTVIASGEVLFIDATQNATLDRVSIEGAVTLAGTRPLAEARTGSELVRSVNDLEPDGYGLFSVIVRRDTVTNGLTLVPYSIAAGLSGRASVALQGNDILWVFSRNEARALAAIATRDFNSAYDPSNVASTNGTNNANNAPRSQETPGDQGSVDNTGASNPTDMSGSGSTDTSGAPTGITPDPNTVDRNPPSGSSYPPALAGANTDAGAPTRTPAQRGDVRSGGDPLMRDLAARELGQSNSPRPLGKPSDDFVIDKLAEAMRVPKQLLVRAAADNLVLILDQVLSPGPYLAGPNTSLDDVLKIAGGPLRQADLSSIEVTSTAVDQLRGSTQTARQMYPITANLGSVTIHPMDVVRVRGVYVDREQGTVTLAGEVRFPGIYDITRGERLSSLIERAGGLTEVSYPYGSIFTRKSAAIGEREGNERNAHELQDQIVMYLAQPSQTGGGGGNVEYLLKLVKEVREAPVLGRITVTADPAVLATRPELDLLLQAGDTLYIPKRPSSVSVTGEVLHPGSLQFRSNYRFDDYLSLAGGVTRSADAGNAFVIFPDGTASSASTDWLSYRDQGHVPPGSVIVVPRDLRPFNWGDFLKDATQIISQLAVTAASLSVIRNN